VTHNAVDDMAILKWFMLETDSNIKYTPGKGKSTMCMTFLSIYEHAK